jgi:hypothetical protein
VSAYAKNLFLFCDVYASDIMSSFIAHVLGLRLSLIYDRFTLFPLRTPMALPPISIKRHNHRVYFCTSERKNELIDVLIASHSSMSIAIVTTLALELPEHITVAAEITSAFDLIIVYDLPQDSEAYINRLSFANQFVFMLLAPEEQNVLYPIETILGRTLVQERLEGFAQPIPAKEKPNTERHAHDNRNQSDHKRSHSGRKPSGFVKKDENGKPIFSKKSGERNHRYDGTPKSEDEKTTKKPFKPKGDKARYEGKKAFDGPKKPFGSKPKSDRYDKKGSAEGKRPYDGKPREERSDEQRSTYTGKKPFDGAKKSFDGPKKPFGSKPKSDRYDDKKGSAEGKRPYEGKPKSDRYDDKRGSGENKKPYGEGKKPFDKSKSYDSKGAKPFGKTSKSYNDKPAAPKRAPKKFILKAPPKPSKEG